jgi:hypothetical protein
MEHSFDLQILERDHRLDMIFIQKFKIRAMKTLIELTPTPISTCEMDEMSSTILLSETATTSSKFS